MKNKIIGIVLLLLCVLASCKTKKDVSQAQLLPEFLEDVQ